MAAEKLKVKLTTRLAGIGKEGEIVEVSHAQAKNYLVPKGLGILMDDKAVADEAARLKKKQDQKRRLIEDRHKIAEKLHGQTMRFELAGASGKVFGGIGEHEIIERIKKDYGFVLERKNVALPEGHHLKKEGTTDIKVHLGEDTYVRLRIEVAVKA